MVALGWGVMVTASLHFVLFCFLFSCCFVTLLVAGASLDVFSNETSSRKLSDLGESVFASYSR